ncbi:riboflavin synthase [uncultured Oxalicibacterium sp.]|uniref:riboflavin synthase n=1 Tax=uncultured Oxalicibacterium sp. TaxID=1168540 RepID=UPI0025D5EEA7|nr:riboflavin synthase [uncultured Oxalicibacterium sp.]
MFTGIVAAIGTITSISPLGDAQAGHRLTIDAGGLPLADVALGDSITVNGACMTVIEKSDTYFKVDVSRESLNCTAGLDLPGEVNLEKAVTLSERLGGHLVSGHVDGLGEVVRFEPIGESWLLTVAAPKDLARYLAFKGSIVINGVSLTVNAVVDTPDSCEFSVNLIPHTVQVTTLKHLKPGVKVNLEVDLIARYCERILSLSEKK